MKKPVDVSPKIVKLFEDPSFFTGCQAITTGVNITIVGGIVGLISYR